MSLHTNESVINSEASIYSKVENICKALSTEVSHTPLSWHSEVQNIRRLSIFEDIVNLIQSTRPNASYEWRQRLRVVAKFLEHRLYFSSVSFIEYNSSSTLIGRLHDLIEELVREASELNPKESSEVASIAENPIANTSLELGSTADVEETPRDDSPGIKEQIQIKPMKFSKKLLLQGPNGSNYAPIKQVSSQGCSRVFIIKVLYKVSDFVKGKSLPSIFTFKRELVLTWLQESKEACCSSTMRSEEAYFGGASFRESDASTYWTEPHQLYTWWKNNVERRNKFKLLLLDSQYTGKDPRQLARARWCELVVALTEIIRSSSGTMNNLRGRYTTEQLFPSSKPSSLAVKSFENDESSIKADNLTIYDYLVENASPKQVSVKRKREYSKDLSVFPLKLYDLLEACDSKEPSTSNSLSSISPISWSKTGDSFLITNPSGLQEFLEKHFNHNNVKSFQRQLNIYGFQKTTEKSLSSYRHPLFKRGERESVINIKRASAQKISSLSSQDSAEIIETQDTDVKEEESVDDLSDPLPNARRSGRVPKKSRLIDESYDYPIHSLSSDYKNQRNVSRNSSKELALDLKKSLSKLNSNKESENISENEYEDEVEIEEEDVHITKSSSGRTIKSRKIYQSNDTDQKITRIKSKKTSTDESNESSDKRLYGSTYLSPRVDFDVLSDHAAGSECRRSISSRIGRKFQAAIPVCEPIEPSEREIHSIISNRVYFENENTQVNSYAPGCQIIVKFPYRPKITQQRQLLLQISNEPKYDPEDTRTSIMRFGCVVRPSDSDSEIEEEDTKKILVFDGGKNSRIHRESIMQTTSEMFPNWSLKGIIAALVAFQKNGDDIARAKAALDPQFEVSMKDVVELYFFFSIHAKQRGGYRRLIDVFKRSIEEISSISDSSNESNDLTSDQSEQNRHSKVSYIEAPDDSDIVSISD